MLPNFKRIILITLTVFFASHVLAQEQEAIPTSTTDSLQDRRMLQLDQQISMLKSLLSNNMRLLKSQTDSLESENEILADQVQALTNESALLREKLLLAFREIEESQSKALESKRKFKKIYFITVPVLLLVSLTLFAILLTLLSRFKNSVRAKINALRKYTYEGIEEVRADYVSEIRRRMKKIASKLKASGKKKSGAKKSKNPSGAKKSKNSSAKSKGKSTSSGKSKSSKKK